MIFYKLSNIVIYRKKMKRFLFFAFYLLSFFPIFSGAGKEPIANAFYNGKINSIQTTNNLLQNNEIENYTYYNFGLIEKTYYYTNDSNHTITELFYNPAFNPFLKTEYKQNIFIKIMIDPMEYIFHQNKVVITGKYEALELEFDSLSTHLVEITETDLQTKTKVHFVFQYNSENLLDTVYKITENYESITLKCYYDGLLKEIPKPYFSQAQVQNIFYLNTEEILIFSKNEKTIPKYKVFITSKPGDQKEPETLEEIENQFMQRIYRFDTFGNITKVYGDFSEDWLYQIENVLDAYNNWISQKIFRKREDGSTFLYYDYSRKINYIEQ